MEELSTSDKTKEKLKFNVEVLRLSVIAILTIGGGTVALIDQYVFSGKRNITITTGFILLTVLGILLHNVVKTINKTIK